MATLPRYTHHIPWDIPGKRHTMMKAICGAIIERGESAPRPTCPACQKILREWEAADEEIAAALEEAGLLKRGGA